MAKPTLSKEDEIKIFCKHMLVNRIFMGHYQERRFAEMVNSYRDVVVVESSEDNLQSDLITVKKRIEKVYNSKSTWVGITEPDIKRDGVRPSLWVKFSDLPFGKYWFQIKQVKFYDTGEIRIQLLCLRSVHDFSSSELEVGKKSAEKEFTQSDIISTFTKFTENISCVMSWENFKNAVQFVFVFTVAVFTGLLYILQYIGNYSLCLMTELSRFVHVMTPTFLAIIDFFSKCVGAFFIFLTMMWNGNKRTERPMPTQHALPIAPADSVYRRQGMPRYR